MEHTTLQTNLVDLLAKPKLHPQISKPKDLSFLSNPKLNYQLIVNSNNEKARVYKRRVSDQLKETDLLNWRAQIAKPIVKAKLIQNIKNSQRNGNADQPIEIHTQHITNTFEQIKDLSLAQSLYLLKKCISGFEAILKKLGYVCLDSKTCGITQKGDCKVWINDNLSENKGGMRPKLQQEYHVVSQILKLIKKCSSNQCASFFSHLLKQIPTFEKLKFRLVDDVINSYCCKNQITIPLYLKYYEQAKTNDQNASSTPNEKIEVAKNKDGKSYSNYSNSNLNRHRGSDATFSGTNILKPLQPPQQRASLFQVPALWRVKSSNQQVNKPDFIRTKNSISTTTSFLRSTYSGSNFNKFESKSSNSNSNSNKNAGNRRTSNPSSQDCELQVIPSINNIRRSQNGQKNQTQSVMKNSFNNEMVSLNNILCSIKEDLINDKVESDHVIQNTRKELQTPSSNYINHQNVVKSNKKRIYHQFCINLIYENSNSSISSTPNKNSLKTSFATTIKSSPFGRASLKHNIVPFSIHNNTPRMSFNQNAKNYKKSVINTSYYDLKRDFDDGNLSPRFSCEQILSKQQKQRSFDFDFKCMQNPVQKEIPCYCVREVQSSSFIPSDKEIDRESNKENFNKVYLKIAQQKRLNNKRRNSRLLRQKLDEVQRQKLDEIKMWQQENKILSANNWKKVVNNLIQSQSELTESVSFDIPGQIKKNQNLIRLDKLDQYGHGLTQSIIPQWAQQ